MIIETSELIFPALDWAVAKCRGKGLDIDDPWLTVDGIADQPLHSYTPSTDWSQGGPIIEREEISVFPFDDHRWEARWKARCECIPQRSRARFIERRGPTPLIAAMRCYVASRLGDEVEIPEGLL